MLAYSESLQRDYERKCCPKCGQPLPHPDKYGIGVRINGLDYRGKFISLSPFELRIFEALLKLAPHPITRERAFALVYASALDGGPQSRLFDVLVMRLRRKLKKTGLKIETIYAVGWRLVLP